MANSAASLVTLGLGLAAGVHGATYGAYKDSPHESFLLRRFVREIALAVTFAASFVLLGLDDNETPFVLYLTFFALTRIATEFWKLFVRVEPQDEFRIPTQMHIVKGVVHNRAARLAFGIGFLASIYGIYALSTLATDMPTPLRGLVVGLAIGCAEAIAGAYKDGSIEGFHLFKFFKSPTFGALGGLIASGHTGNVMSLLFAAIGSMRMLLELVFKMIVPSYVPGKFRSMQGPYVEWTARRGIFLMPYALTWALYLALATHANWVSVAVMAASTPTAHRETLAGNGLELATCGDRFVPVAERAYIVRGRVRPALFWTGRHRVGDARFTEHRSETGDRRIDLLVETDLDRAPMRLNRWRFVAETTCGSNAHVLDATEAIASRPSERVLAAVPVRFRSLPMNGRQADGFLTAVTDAVRETVVRHREGTARPDGIERTYEHEGKTYRLITRPIGPESVPIPGHPDSPALGMTVTILDASTQPIASFDLAIGTTGSESNVPLRAVYRPHWWLEIEFLVASAPEGV